MISEIVYILIISEILDTKDNTQNIAWCKS